MEENILNEIINEFYKQELLDEDIKDSEKKKLHNKKMYEMRTEIDSLVSEIEKDLKDSGEYLGSGELKKLRHNIVLALDRMNKRGIRILDGSGKIDSEAVKKIIKEENSKVELKANHRENIEEQIDIAEVKTKKDDEIALFEKLKGLNLSEEDFEYYSGAIERERERERKRQQDIETMGEEKANAKALEDFSRDADAQCDALAVAAVRSGNNENIMKVDELRSIRKQMEDYQKKGDKDLTEEEKEHYKQIKGEYDIGVREFAIQLVEDGLIEDSYKINYFRGSYINKDETSEPIWGRENNGSAEKPEIIIASLLQQKETIEQNGRYPFIKMQKEKKYDGIRNIDEIASLIAEGVSRREISNALKIFADIVNKSRNINELENIIETRIKEKENRGEPLSEEEILILRTFRKIDYEGESLDEILQSEKKDELIDRIEEIAESIEREIVSMAGGSDVPQKGELTPGAETIIEQAKRYTTPLHEMRHATVDERTSEEDAIGKAAGAIMGQLISDKEFNPCFYDRNETLVVSFPKEAMYTDVSMLGKNENFEELYEMRDDDTGIIEDKTLSETLTSNQRPPLTTSIVEEMTVDGSGATPREQSGTSKKVTLSASTMKALVESQAEARKMLEASGIIHGQTPERPTTGKTETQVAPVADSDEKSGGEPDEH